MSSKANISQKKGFTMVEVLIVGVIVAVLATIAVMIYQGYIRESKQQTVNSLAETAAASANSFLRRTGQDPNVANLNLHLPDPTQYTINIDKTNKTVMVTDAGDNSITATAQY
jgi:prepilin-type N-terminal cleavage/methylation domain-containing protein